jgi:hypothetical protein
MQNGLTQNPDNWGTDDDELLFYAMCDGIEIFTGEHARDALERTMQGQPLLENWERWLLERSGR